MRRRIVAFLILAAIPALAQESPDLGASYQGLSAQVRAEQASFKDKEKAEPAASENGFKFSDLGIAIDTESAEAPTGVTVEQIIKNFSTKESEFRKELPHYSFVQTVAIDQLTRGGDIEGQMYEKLAVTHDHDGKRWEKVLKPAPVPTLKLTFTGEDKDDLENIQPFSLTAEEVGKYEISYVGRKKVPAGNSYVFTVIPKRFEKDQHYFAGLVYVGQKSLQILQTHGKRVPDIIKGHCNENRFPVFVTWRDKVDGQYWFPIKTYSDGTLPFSACAGGPIRLRMTITWDDYKRLGSEVDMGEDTAPPADAQSAPKENKQ